MKLNIRDYHMVLIALYLIMHGLNIILIEFHTDQIGKLLYHSVPAQLFLAVDCISIASIGFLLYGLLTFTKSVILGWFIFLSIAWHFPFALIIINGVMVKYKEISSANYFLGTLVPAIQLCIWSVIMINTFRYWCILKDFKKLADYLRNDPSLLELSHHRYETDKLRKTILEKRYTVTYSYRIR